MPLTTGDNLGPYQILAPIGVGGMGEVWKARDTRLNRIVAIKQLKGQHSARFQQEARAIASLNHPHICQIYDVGPDYLVLEFVEGTPLRGPLKAEQALPLALQIVSALEAAHKRGILHRDLKPGNVMVTEAGAKLLDFGLAKLTQDQDADATCTTDGTVAGTPAYMSPEQAQAHSIDVRSDIFSLGAVLYEVLSGRRAFVGSSMLDILNAVVRDDPAPLESPLSSVVKRCLAKKPCDRFQSTAELKAALLQAETKPGTQPPSIAVLPFLNMSRDAEDEFFSDGLTEEIINALVKIPGLKVIARTSAFAFRGQNIDIRSIAEILGVTNVLEGSVRRAANRIRVTAQLITAVDGSHLWSERYDRQMDDLFAMQDEIATAIAGELKVKFSPREHARRQPKFLAYEAYLRYRQYQWLFTPAALTRSRECLEQAIALDPEFALPYVGLADHYFASTTFGGADQLVPKARQLAERALELDPELPEAHAMLGVLAAFWNPDWKEAERRFQVAMAREPVPWHVRSWYATFYLRPLGNYAEARKQSERALEDDPLSQMLHSLNGKLLQGGGWDAEAAASYARALELDPRFWVGHWNFGMYHAVAGRFAEARTSAESAFATLPHPYTMGLLAGVLQAAGDTARAGSLLSQTDNSQGRALGMACFHLIVGEIDQAVEWAGRALSEGYPMNGNLFIWPFERQLRKSPGWAGLMKKMNLPETR